MNRIYFDHAATTQVDQAVADLMFEYMTDKFGNPSSIHGFGREAFSAVDKARQQVADLIGATPEEIYFTSGGTEGDNLAIKGIAYANKNKGKHIITTSIEHHAVLHTCQQLEQEGFEVTYLPVNDEAVVDIEVLRQAITPGTILISIMYANNEVGSIQPIEDIVRLGHEYGIDVHTDAVQVAGNYPINVTDCPVDALTLSGHKFYGPKGIGAIYVRKGTRILAIQQGGGQEKNLRAGTENVPGIVGLGLAAEVAQREMVDRVEQISNLRDQLIRGIMKSIPDTKINGHASNRLPGNVNFSFIGVEGESLLLNLDMKGIAASSGSACSSGSLSPSHVLLAMGLPHEVAHGSLRITLGRHNTEQEVNYLLEVLPPIIERLRSMSAWDGQSYSKKQEDYCSNCQLK